VLRLVLVTVILGASYYLVQASEHRGPGHIARFEARIASTHAVAQTAFAGNREPGNVDHLRLTITANRLAESRDAWANPEMCQAEDALA
jgi:hypothetical protein